MNNKQVIQNWKNNESGHSNNMSTNGQDIYSYSLQIGTTMNKHKILFNYSSRKIRGTKGISRSATTSNHISQATEENVYLVNPNSTHDQILREIVITKMEK